jgi:crossover junction endodeoxyribonuclease RusA
MIELELPFPPTLNTMWRRGPRSTYLSQRGKQYRSDVLGVVRQQGVWETLDQRLAVTIVLYPPDKRQRDLDNYPKAILDSLTHAKVWVDDSQVDELVVRRGEKVKGGRADVRIEVME